MKAAEEKKAIIKRQDDLKVELENKAIYLQK
jgi:hypothetical protein